MMISEETWSRRRFPIAWLLLLLVVHLVALLSWRDESVPLWPQGVGLSVVGYLGFIFFRFCSFEGETPSVRRGIGTWTGAAVGFSSYLMMTGSDEWLLPSVLVGAIAASDMLRQAWRSRSAAQLHAAADEPRSTNPRDPAPLHAARS